MTTHVEFTPQGVRRAHPAELCAALDARFAGEPWLAWEPETLLAQVGPVDEPGADKLLAVAAFAANPAMAARDARAFEKVVLAFTNCPCLPEAWQEPHLEEVFYAVRQMAAILAAVHGAQPLAFTGEVPGYVAAVARHRGFVVLPKALAFAQDLLDHLSGLEDGGARRRENAELVERLAKALDGLDSVAMDREAILASHALDLLDPGTPGGAALAKLLGCYLFDPTILP